MEINPGSQPTFLEQRQQLACRPRVGGRLEHDEHPCTHDARQLARTRDERSKVGLAIVGQRRRHADQDRVAFAQNRVITRDGEAACRLELRVVNVLDV